jgi:hypothetical protein
LALRVHTVALLLPSARSAAAAARVIAPAVPAAAVVAMNPHRLEQAGPARAGRPHRHGGHRLARVVVGDQTARIGVRRAGRHRVPTVVGSIADLGVIG